jgi:GH15 family glucan-1,4-alpha-glucosidase
VTEPDEAGTTQPEISDYAFLSDCHSAALVTSAGSVDWWCVPRFDSPSVFGRLLDPEAGGWTLGPVEQGSSTRRYLEDSLVVETVHTTSTGTVAVIDTLLLEDGARGHDLGMRSPHILLRRVEGRSGQVAMTSRFAPRMEYGRTIPHLHRTTSGVEAVGGPATLTFAVTTPEANGGAVTVDVDPAGATVSFMSDPATPVELRVGYRPTFGVTEGLADLSAGGAAETTRSWTSWASEHTGYDGPFGELVRRSSVVLQGLTYAPSGAVVAAATTSLPETMGGGLNWDYRYAWLRDLSLTMRSLWIAACPAEPTRLFGWLAGSTGHLGTELVQIMYGVEGERNLHEHRLEHLRGYRDSAPVRVGNDAWKQKQLDVMGEVLDAASLLADNLAEDGGPFESGTQELLIALADRAASAWHEPDAGMWEARGEERHYTSSKVMCWVALDRAVRLAARLGEGADPDRWTQVAGQIKSHVLEHAWSQQAGAYAGALGSDDLDASVLLLPVVGFLPADEPRMRQTIDAIARELGTGDVVRRWASDRSGFLICTYWLVECLALAGEHQEAVRWFLGANAHASDLGLLAEETDVESGQLLGNYPQAFSHVGLINAAWRLGQAAGAPRP